MSRARPVTFPQRPLEEGKSLEAPQSVQDRFQGVPPGPIPPLDLGKVTTKLGHDFGFFRGEGEGSKSQGRFFPRGRRAFPQWNLI